MTAKKQDSLPDYWSVYKAINFKRFSSDREFTDKTSGKTMRYDFIGEEKFSSSRFLRIFSGLLWMSFPLLVITLAIVSLYVMAYVFAIIAITLYHFAAMYYVIRGPHTEISEVKKKGIFSRK
jgi:hypothetical protein